MATASGSAPGPRKPLIEVAGRSLLEHSLAAFGRVAEVARRLNKYEFLFTAAPLRIELGMGSPLNPIATF